MTPAETVHSHKRALIPLLWNRRTTQVTSSHWVLTSLNKFLTPQPLHTLCIATGSPTKHSAAHFTYKCNYKKKKHLCTLSAHISISQNASFVPYLTQLSTFPCLYFLSGQLCMRGFTCKRSQQPSRPCLIAGGNSKAEVVIRSDLTNT